MIKIVGQAELSRFKKNLTKSSQESSCSNLYCFDVFRN